jgi:nitroimidazol reductase NimA-like FMN-containing flavoprotein (pyridoxamine 5'-phosphate oxidase superfamily)
MFKEMRRKEKQLSGDDTAKIVMNAEFGTLATLGKDGYPYAVPLNYAYENGAIYFHSAKAGNKLENILHHNKVCFSIVGYAKLLPEKFDTEYDSAVIYGKAAEVTGESEKKHALALLIEKYSGGYLEQGMAYIEKSSAATAVIKIEIEKMTGKRGR